MLETIDTIKKIDQEAYRQWFPRLKADLRELQQRIREAKLPVLVIFEGLHMSGKADSIKHLGEALDPRGFTVHMADHPGEEETQRHWMGHYWVRLPARGKTALFERSWYTRVLDERVLHGRRDSDAMRAYQEINQTEEMLAADGALVLKFWLHMSRKEQKRRIRKSEKDPLKAHTITSADWDLHDRYDQYLEYVEEMLERTSSHVAPWILVEADDHRFRRMKIFQAIAEQVAHALNKRPARRSAPVQDKISVPALEEMPTLLDKVDLTKTTTADEYEREKVVLQLRLRKLQQEAIECGVTQLIVYEGWDAAGKGGSIRRLTTALDPRYYDVIPIGKPTQEELDHHYLWRFWKHLPKWGHLTIFDRSWYGRVLVERIEGFCREDDWRRAYQEINEFEMMLYRSGISIVKIWLHITPEEQLRRFKAREADPNKRHKLTDEDWRNRDKWAQYHEAVDEMVTRTSTTYAPWTIIEGDCKRHARVRTMKTLIESWERAIADTRKRRKKNH